MEKRLQLQTLLESMLGSRNVYFQPPANLKMKYPAIVYSWDNLDVKHADNELYNHTKRYQVTYIDKDPDSEIPMQIAKMRLCSLSRTAFIENLNHYYFDLYY